MAMRGSPRSTDSNCESLVLVEFGRCQGSETYVIVNREGFCGVGSGCALWGGEGGLSGDGKHGDDWNLGCRESS